MEKIMTPEELFNQAPKTADSTQEQNDKINQEALKNIRQTIERENIIKGDNVIVVLNDSKFLDFADLKPEEETYRDTFKFVGINEKGEIEIEPVLSNGGDYSIRPSRIETFKKADKQI